MKKLLLIITFCTTLYITAFAQDFKVDQGRFIQETQRTSNENHIFKIVWWIPVDFWPIVLSQSPNVTKEQMDNIVSLLKDYNLVAIVDGKLSELGEVQYVDVAELRNSIFLKDNSGVIYKPLSDDEINSGTKTLIETMKPVLSNMMGKMGQNMQFFVFPIAGKDKVLIADPKKQGLLTIGLSNDTYKFKLPLEALLKPKKCPIDNEEMAGSWLYCPWHGVKLE